MRLLIAYLLFAVAISIALPLLALWCPDCTIPNTPTVRWMVENVPPILLVVLFAFATYQLCKNLENEP